MNEMGLVAVGREAADRFPISPMSAYPKLVHDSGQSPTSDIVAIRGQAKRCPRSAVGLVVGNGRDVGAKPPDSFNSEKWATQSHANCLWVRHHKGGLSHASETARIS